MLPGLASPGPHPGARPGVGARRAQVRVSLRSQTYRSISLEKYKAISKALGLPLTTVRAPGVQQQLIEEVTKDATTTSKELQASLASVKVSVHDSTIRKRLGKMAVRNCLMMGEEEKCLHKSSESFLSAQQGYESALILSVPSQK
ncbi:hypothetical protein QTP86_016291 [Hemibagrus guttatus]|nr:hypothetical protein QTP86_016291 [Hemibagrus guttatus]